MFPFSLSDLILVVPIFILSLTVHEFAHSSMALLLGDSTSKNMGRFSLNPLKHIDPAGFVLFLVAGFGWAKPVLIDRRNLKDPFKDDILISLAGPISNFILACIGGLILRIMLTTGIMNNGIMQSIIIQLIFVNLSLGVFNLIPIPPLDGSHIITNILEKINPELAYKFYRMGSILIILLILGERITGFDFFPIETIIEKAFRLILQYIVGV